MRIGIVADTHIPKRARFLPAALIEGLRGVHMILHAGDLTTAEVLDNLTDIAPVHAVGGNNDSTDLILRLDNQKIISAGGFHIGLVHGHEGVGRTTPDRALRTFADQKVDCVVFGHSHLPYCQVHGGILVFNPGSPTDRRRAPFPSFGLLEVTSTGLQGRLIELGR